MTLNPAWTLTPLPNPSWTTRSEQCDRPAERTHTHPSNHLSVSALLSLCCSVSSQRLTLIHQPEDSFSFWPSVNTELTLSLTSHSIPHSLLFVSSCLHWSNAAASCFTRLDQLVRLLTALWLQKVSWSSFYGLFKPSAIKHIFRCVFICVPCLVKKM